MYFMQQSDQSLADSPPGQDKEFAIIVNGREKTISQSSLTFDELAVLAFGPLDANASVLTATYQKGPGPKERGGLVQGELVKLKTGMLFNVSRTDRS